MTCFWHYTEKKRQAGNYRVAVAAATSLQSCPTLCNPTDGSALGSSVPWILQARTLEWAAISFSNARKWKMKVKSLSCAWLLATPWTAAYQAPPSGIFQARVLEWVATDLKVDLKIDVSWFPALDSLFHSLCFVQSKTTLHICTMNFFSNHIDLSAGFEWSALLVILVYDLCSPCSKLQESGAVFNLAHSYIPSLKHAVY